MQIKDLMKLNPSVITQDWTLEETAQKMLELHTGILPVVEGSKDQPGKKLMGVVTDRDMIVRCINEGKDPKTTKVTEAYTKDVIYSFEDDTDKQAFDRMLEHDIGRLLILNHNDELTGIISMADIIANAPGNIWESLPANRDKNESYKDSAAKNFMA
ncbi:MAG: CBS domain-containing protein [Alphaproteobacteria bacterium]|nr:CBS domain-containing protein [Alphaproteobacteria bacterium]